MGVSSFAAARATSTPGSFTVGAPTRARRRHSSSIPAARPDTTGGGAPHPSSSLARSAAPRLRGTGGWTASSHVARRRRSVRHVSAAGSSSEMAGDGSLDDVASGYSDAGPGISDIQDLLDVAVAEENFEEAARLRDRLNLLRDNSAAAVADCNERFYQAFRSSSMSAMREVWGRGQHVQCLHPGAACIAGSEQVLSSWEIVFASMPPGAGLDVRVEQLRVHASQGWGFVTCVERVDSDTGVGKLAATNVFEVQDGEWKIIHHQAHGIVGA